MDCRLAAQASLESRDMMVREGAVKPLVVGTV